MEKIKDFTIKHTKLLYIIAAAVIIIISCYFGFQGQENWTSEKYGTTSDGQIAIKENSQVAVKFRILNDEFNGIYIRISPATKYFTKEKLLFTLIDDNKETVIAKYEMLLKNEMLNTDSFVKLPCPDSQNRDVTLFINGTDISVVPYLYVSKDSNINSELYVNGIKDDNDLVFSAVYKEVNKYNIKYFVKGGLLILLLFVCWYTIKTDKSIVISNQDESYVGYVNLKKNKKKAVIYWGITFFVFIFLTLFIYKAYIVKVLDKREDDNVVNENVINDIVINSVNTIFENTIKVNENALTSLSYCVSTNNVNDKAKVHVMIEDEESKYKYYDKVISLHKLVKNEGIYTINLQTEYIYSKDRRVKVSIEAVDFDTANLLIRAGEYTKKSECKINGKKIFYSPIVTISYANNFFVKKMYMIYVFIILILLFLVMYLLYVKNATVEKYFVFFALLLGLLYLFIIPVYVVPDENTHADTAYIISNKILGIKEIDKPNYIYKRTCDVQTEYANEHDAKLYMYRRLSNICDNYEEKNALEVCYVNNAIANASTIFYIPAAVGISIARLVDVGSYMMLFLGRMFNYLVYVFLTYLGIKKMPYKKELLCVISLLPISVQQAASFSYDSVLDGLAFLFVGYCMFFLLENKYESVDVIVFIISIMLMSYIKGGVYMPLCFLIFLIPVEKNVKIDRNQIVKYILLSCFILCSYVHNNIAQMIQRLYLSSGTNINDFNGKSLFTLSDVISSPLLAVKMYINTLIDRFDFYLQTMLGGQLGSFNISMSWWNIIVYILIIFMITSNRIKIVKLKTISKIVIYISSIVSFCLVLLSMFVSSTNITSTIITGVQGRYFLPIIVFPLIVISLNDYFAIREDSIINAKKRIRNNMILFFLNHIYMLLYLIVVIANKK